MMAHRREPSAQASVDRGVGAIESTPDRREDVLDRGEQRVRCGCGRRARSAPARSTQMSLPRVDHHLGDRGVVQPPFEATQRRLLGDEVDHAALCRGWASERGSRDGEQAGVDGAGDRRVVLHLGHHRRAQGALDVACGERSARLADQHDAGGASAEPPPGAARGSTAG